jgi:type VI protein secretion system component VasF
VKLKIKGEKKNIGGKSLDSVRITMLLETVMSNQRSRDTWSSSSVGVGMHGSVGTGEGVEEALVSLEYE